MRSARWMSPGVRATGAALGQGVGRRSASLARSPTRAACSPGPATTGLLCDSHDAYALKGRSMAPGSRSRMSADAIGAIEVDRIEDVDVRLEDEIRRRRVPGIRRPTGRRAAILPVPRPRVGAVLQEHGGRLVVAVERCRMERRVSRRTIDRRLLIVFHVDDRQAGAVAHDRAQQRLRCTRPERAAARVHEEPRPSAVVRRRQELRDRRGRAARSGPAARGRWPRAV